MSTIFDGITQHTVRTPRLTASVLERPGGAEQPPVVFVHGNVSSSLFWQPTMLALPEGRRALAIDLRGFGDSETLPVDATRGVRDFSDDVLSVLDELAVAEADIVGWSMGAGVVMQLMLDRPGLARTVTFVSPVSPYGFGGTTGVDGTPLTVDGAGTGGGAANPDFVAALQAGDTTADAPASPRTVYRTAYVKNPDGMPFEDVWVESMLSTRTGPDNYPGDSVASQSWPGFGAGTRGVLNTMAPAYFDVSGIVALEPKPPILWIHGADDAIVGDATFFDLNMLGKAGIVPGWPGDEVAPPQPMIQQTRAVFERYGAYREVVFEDCGHSAHIEYPERFAAELHAHLG